MGFYYTYQRAHPAGDYVPQSKANSFYIKILIFVTGLNVVYEWNPPWRETS